MNLTTQHEMGSKTDPVDVAGGDGDEDDDDDDEELDEDQLEEYKDMIKQLGDFPVRGTPFWLPSRACAQP